MGVKGALPVDALATRFAPLVEHAGDVGWLWVESGERSVVYARPEEGAGDDGAIEEAVLPGL